ncbi:unnamed protein product [Didymodactylos carnosus]|uniref:Uncharacterized protein n=1 Tax=Didymodactylos carnosus TaxID=1234261 RepID=A0A814Z9X5_9BILA|nr:unnamed protein product [Didymodactylos carnosus]CAF4004439.1 unnamed protein product [Didymodactylos carnosus]
MRRHCVLVRSKVDRDYLMKFKTYSGQYYLRAEPEEREALKDTILAEIKRNNSGESNEVYLVACDYSPPNSDADQLIQDQSFDFHALLGKVASLAATIHPERICSSAMGMFVQTINTCFRRGYILNSLKYGIACGVAAAFPCGDQVPRYLLRRTIRKALGSDVLVEYLQQLDLTVYGYEVQTSIFKKCVKIEESESELNFAGRSLGQAASIGFILVGTFSDDVIRLVAPATAIASGVARSALTVSTIGVGIVISIAVSLWSGNAGAEHIFSYVNRICNDFIMIAAAFVRNVIEETKR